MYISNMIVTIFILIQCCSLSTRNDAVKRVEIPSAGALPKSRGTEKPEAMVDPDTNPLQIDNLKENL